MKLERRTVIDMLAAVALAAVCLGATLYGRSAEGQVSAPPVTPPPTETRRPILTVNADGTIELGADAVIDFATVTPRAGRCRGFVQVRVQGEIVLMPVYTLPSDERVFRCDVGSAK